MKTVFWGFFLILLNFNLSFNSHVLNLLPDFAGYLLLYRAGEALAEENRRFGQLRPFEMGMAVYTGLLWVGDLLGVTSSGPVSTLLGLAAAVVALPL